MKTRLVLALLGALAPMSAFADPIAIATSIKTFFTIAAPYIWAATTVIAVYGSVQSRRKAKAAAARARAEYNANLVDRSTSLLSAAPPLRGVYGRVMTGGDVVAVLTSDKTGRRATNWQETYVKPDAYKHIVIHIASHACEAVHGVYISGVYIGDLDAGGSPICTSNGTAKDYVVGVDAPKGATSISVASGSGTILINDEISFPGSGTRYKVVGGITGPGVVVIAAPGLQVPVPAGSAVILGNEFNTVKEESTGAVVPAGGSYTHPYPIITMTNFGITLPGDGGWMSYDHMVTLSPDRLTISNAHTETVSGAITFRSQTPSITVKLHLGDPDQTADTYLNGIKPAEWTTDHRLRGLTYAVVTVDLEEPKFQSWDPSQLTFDVSGRKVYDPRSGLTQFSNNSALCIRDYLLAEWGGECTASDIDDSVVITSANVCDELITLQVGSDVTPDQKRYTCNGVVSSSDDFETVLTDMSNSMAGMTVYSAQWMVLAGAWSAPVVFLDGTDVLTEADLSGLISVVQAAEGLDTLFNGVRGQYFSAGRATPSDMEPYQNAAFKLADGRDLWTNLPLPFTDNKARCGNIARIMVEKNRDGLTIGFPATLKAWPLQIGDRVKVTNAALGFSNKTFRVTDWQFSLTAPVLLTLQEDGAGAYDLLDAVSADPEPNSALANPWFVRPVSNLVATSGLTTLITMADGTVIPRVLLTWNQIVDPYSSGSLGRVFIKWRRPWDADWTWVDVPGEVSSYYITGLAHDDPVQIQVYVVNSLGYRSDSVFLSHVVQAIPGLPPDVTGLTAEVKPGQVWIRWNAATFATYANTEVRVDGTDWDSATVLWSGSGRDYQWPRPVNGMHTVRVKHTNRAGDYSANAASVDVLVTDSIDVGTPGTRTAFLDLFQWAPLVPTLFPVGVSTYTWATGAWNAPVTPNGWEKSPAAPTTGMTLYRARQTIIDTTVDETTDITWSVTAADVVGHYGLDGSSAYWANVSASAIRRTSSGAFVPATLTIEGKKQSGSDPVIAYAGRWTIELSADGASFGAPVYTSSVNESIVSGYVITGATLKLVRVRMYLAGGLAVMVDEHIIPVVDDGTSGITTIVSNRAHGLPADANGVVSTYTGSGTTIEVWEGTNKLTFSSAGTPGTFSIGIPVVSPAGALTVGSITGSGTQTATVAQHVGASVSQDVIFVSYPLTIKTANGGTITLNERQTLTKAKAGAVGTRGTLTGYSTIVTPPIYMSGAVWSSPTDDTSASTIIWRMLGNAGSPPSNAHLRIGDTITLQNNPTTAAETKYWGGSSWLAPGQIFSGNLLVGGTISGGTNLNITGYAKIEGNRVESSGSLGDGTIAATGITVATAINTSRASQAGLYVTNNNATYAAAVFDNVSTGPAVSMSGLKGLAIRPMVSATYTAGSGYGIDITLTGGGVNSIGPDTGIVIRKTGTQSNLGSLIRFDGNLAANQFGLWHNGSGQMIYGPNSSALVQTLTVTGSVTAGNASVFSLDSGGAQFRIKSSAGAGGYGVILRNDGADFYCLLTNLSDANGVWNNFRPLSVSLSTGITSVQFLKLRQTPAAVTPVNPIRHVQVLTDDGAYYFPCYKV